MKRAFLISFCSVALLSACPRTESTVATDTSATMATETSGSMATETSTTPTAAPYDLQFIDSLTKRHQMAMDLARMGAPKFEHQPLKDAAKMMVDDQTKEIAQLSQWREQWYPGAAPTENMQLPGMSSINMDMSHMSMSGHGLDMMFIDMMIPHHEGGLALGQDALAKAEHPELKELAQTMIDEQRKEIDQMQQWKKAWAK